jgi:DHA1 family bicyclomycin/chloramphenicol resistance-like MFS transporter
MAGDRSRAALPLASLVVLGFMQAVWPLTMDLYLPSFPRIGQELAAAPALVQFTLTGAFVGMAVGQLAAGPVSDRVGRMRPLLVVLVVYTAASVGCALAPTIDLLITARVFQGVGASATAVIILAIIRDASAGTTMLRLLARLQLVNGVFVVASPALGAQLLLLLDWRGLFWVLVGYGVVLTVATASVLLARETNPPERRAGRETATLAADYSALFRDRRFLAVVGAGALAWGAMMTYMASSAFLYQDTFDLSPSTYALLFGGHGALMIIGTQLSARLAARSSIDRLLRNGILALFAVAALLTVSVVLVPDLGLWGFLVPLFAFTTVFGVIAPAIQSVALADHGDRAGSAASLLGASNMVAGAIASPLIGLIGSPGPAPIAVLMTVCTLGSALLVIRILRTDPARTVPTPIP